MINELCASQISFKNIVLIKILNKYQNRIYLLLCISSIFAKPKSATGLGLFTEKITQIRY